MELGFMVLAIVASLMGVSLLPTIIGWWRERHDQDDMPEVGTWNSQ